MITFPTVGARLIPRRGWRAPSAGPMAAVLAVCSYGWRAHSSAHLPAAALTTVLWRSLRQEVGRHQATHTIQLAHIEAVITHLAVYVDHITRVKGQFHLQFKQTPNQN